MARNDTIVRTLTVLRALTESKRGVALKALADKHGFEKRNLYRDIRALEAAGFPIENADGRYWLSASWRIPGPAGIDGDELLALFAALTLSQGLRGTKLGKALQRLWGKLALKNQQGTLLPATNPWLSVRAPYAIDYRPLERLISTIEAAVIERKALRCVYKALSTGEAIDRIIEPTELHWDPGLECLYVLAWCRLRGDVRVFAVHRFLEVERTDEAFVPHPEANAKRSLDKAFRVWRDKNVCEVQVKFAKHLAAEIAERRWSPEQKLITAGDGSVLLSFPVAGLAEVERWVLGYGSGAQVVAPEELVVRVRAHVAGMAVAYGGGVVERRGTRHEVAK
ncbi:MAG: WYL domain-containing transcriptional regulator [Deltaproteobacteria bacterium]|nr:WYL domain-containing transcriptional regulator [Deltaproteobacteria bacterium]